MFNKLLYATISSRGKEAVRRLSHRLSSKPLGAPFLQTRTVIVRPKHEHILRNEFPVTKSAFNTDFITNSRGFSTNLSADQASEGWLAWLGKNKKVIALVTICFLALGNYTSRKLDVSLILFHEPIREVYPGEIGSESIQKVIDDMVKVMRKHNLDSLSAPQIGVPLQIIVTTGRRPKEHYEAEVIDNPKLKKKSREKGLLFESCVSVLPGYAAVVERFLLVEVKGLDRYGQPIWLYSSGRYARVLQKVCDHLEGTVYEGTLYVDKMDKHTSGTKKNTKQLLAKERDQQGVH